jgi:formate hydrogenlyase subunit 3/multisubunit Na+/H+ antiporter MnhD subunit
VAAVDWGAALPILAALLFAGVYYARTTPQQRQAARARTRRIESSRTWQRGPTLLALSVLVVLPGLFLPTWTMFIVGPIAVVLLLAGIACMVIAQRRYG